jgi:HTH-type transcriptional regulator/antitoxin HigA
MLLPNVEDLRHIPRVLAESGIRFIVVEPLPHTRIDGVCFWLDKSSPVVALSLRFDRIDWFWHTLLHELGHVKNRDGQEEVVLDTDLVGNEAKPIKEKPEIERKADLFASQFSIKKSELDGFIARVRPLYSKQKILGFANRVGVHPGIVVGQLQFRDQISYAHSREMLVKVRHLVTEAALTDGWGYMPGITSRKN